MVPKVYFKKNKKKPSYLYLNDEEIANLMSFNLLLGITYATRGLTEASKY